MNEIVERFIDHGRSASFHYADDSGQEWSLGNAERDKALALFDSHPELQSEMRAKAKFLWSLEMARPS